MVPYLLPVVEDRITGVRGIGLDTPIREGIDGFCDSRDGKLLLVRLLAYFKHRVKEKYRTQGLLLPHELPVYTNAHVEGRLRGGHGRVPLHVSRSAIRKRAAATRKFVHTPLSEIFARLPHIRGREYVGRLLHPPIGYDPRNFRIDQLDFENALQLDDGNPRPIHRILRQVQGGRVRRLIRDPNPGGILALANHRYAKEISFHQGPMRGDVAILSDIEVGRLFVFLRERHLLPRNLEHLYGRLHDPAVYIPLIRRLLPEKWKAMKISYPSDRQSYAGMDGFARHVTITGKPNQRGDKTRSSANIQFVHVADDHGHDQNVADVPTRNGQSLLGEAQFFLSIENPLKVLADGYDEDQDPEIQDPDNPIRDDRLLLAYVSKHMIEETHDGLLLRFSRDQYRARNQADQRLSFIHAIAITSLVGILYKNRVGYFTWKDGCWTTHGRD
ncbi:hypothetical protein BJ508DRAFT_332803 [Ascobolus immersus RN42]|uniref:Uncharacterized protein n=1 Tax=Ascobolus immersus RN42 TaxID=1160509 RepID=A0A3N4HLP4_ASCIM|nr:hypothetical protein BJ508DRAFT_332803 [Ascobolus immersus RN42]